MNAQQRDVQGQPGQKSQCLQQARLGDRRVNAMRGAGNIMTRSF